MLFHIEIENNLSGKRRDLDFIVYAGDDFNNFLQPAQIFFVEGGQFCAVGVQDADDFASGEDGYDDLAAG